MSPAWIKDVAGRYIGLSIVRVGDANHFAGI